MSDRNADEPHDEPHDHEEADVETALDRSVSEGVHRLSRPTSALLATGFVGGLDVGLGVLALLIVVEATGSEVLGALAFPIGFVALTLARSELFTENFLVPITTVIAGKATWSSVVRLWVGTGVANLVGGFVIAWILVHARPELGGAAIELTRHQITEGVGLQSFSGAVLAGMIITLMTWMERGSPELLGKLAAAVIAGFLLTATPALHAIVISIEQFVALLAGAPWSYLDWAKIFAWATLGNTLGGVVLVTAVRLVQVGREGIEHASA